MRCASCLAVHLTAPPGWSLLILTRETTQCAGAACRIIMEAGLPFCDKLFFVTAASERTNHGRPVNYREQKESEKMERKPSNWGQNEMLMLPQLFGGSFSTRLPSKMKPEPVILSHIHGVFLQVLPVQLGGNRSVSRPGSTWRRSSSWEGNRLGPAHSDEDAIHSLPSKYKSHSYQHWEYVNAIH